MPSIKVMPFVDKYKNKRIEYDEYEKYFDALANDDSSYVEKFFSGVDQLERNKLINYEFNFTNTKCPLLLKEVGRGETQCTLPLHIAVTNNAVNVARILLRFGADPVALDSLNSNLLHSSVAASFYYPETEDKICETLGVLLNDMSMAQLHNLRVQENTEGLRPVEFAVQQGTIKLMNFMYMKYRHEIVLRSENVGLHTIQWVDIDEYESPERHRLSPLVLFTYMDRSKAIQAMKSFLDCPFFGTWMRAKYSLNLVPIIVWFLMRFVFIIAYFILDRNTHHLRAMNKKIGEENGTNFTKPCYADTVSFQNHISFPLGSFVFSYGSFSIAFDIFDFVMLITRGKYKLYRNLRGWKNVMVSFTFYRYCNFVVSFSVCLWGCIFYAKNGEMDFSEGEIIFISFLRLTIPVHACWSILFFLQLVPNVGRSVLAIRGMLIDMGNFFVLLAIVLFPYVHMLNMYAIFYTNEGCIAEFDGFAKTSYSLFLLMLNMIDFRDYDFQLPGFIQVFHVVYIFMVAIILLNFLIAMMSQSASRVAENEFVTEWLNALAIAAQVQERFGNWLLKPFYLVMKPRFFSRHVSGQLCVVMRLNRNLIRKLQNKEEQEKTPIKENKE